MSVQDGNILVLNSGSSSLKFGLFRPGEGDEEPILTGSAEGIGRPSGSLHVRGEDGAVVLERDHVLESQREALNTIASALEAYHRQSVTAVGHRIVHGGPQLREHVRITPDVLAKLSAATHFAPLHIPQSLQLVQQAGEAFPDALQFACFDTAFHRTLPESASRFALPRRFFEAGVMRYGFHGLSCESVLHRLKPDLPTKVIIAHLGNGSSVTAVQDGKSVDTSMGLTPTGGVPMGTRTGDLDPGVLLYLMRTESLQVDALETMLNRESGLLALSGGESDMQALLQRSSGGDQAAELSVNVFCTEVRKRIGAYVALLGGVDLLIFTGGIGEHSRRVRDQICGGLECIGLLAADPGEGNVVALPSEEELQIARHTRRLLQAF